MKEEIRNAVISFGADVCGFASCERFSDFPSGFCPIDVYKECKSMISFGIALPKGLYDVPSRILYTHFNALSIQKVDDISFKIARYIEETCGGIAIPVPSDSPYEYWEKETLTGRGTISMKHAAVMAGIGTLGKSTLFLNEKYGNRLTLGLVLTNLSLESDPLSKEICLPNCKKCIEECSVHAIEDMHVNQKLCRNNAYGETSRGFPTVECNKCRTVCPMRLGNF